jgi:hypothetical protein
MNVEKKLAEAVGHLYGDKESECDESAQYLCLVRTHANNLKQHRAHRQRIRCSSLTHVVLRLLMGIYKVQISLRVRQGLRSDLEAFAAREKRKLGNLGEVILEWGFEQLKEAGSIDRLLRCKVRPADRGHRKKENERDHGK